MKSKSILRRLSYVHTLPFTLGMNWALWSTIITTALFSLELGALAGFAATLVAVFVKRRTYLRAVGAYTLLDAFLVLLGGTYSIAIVHIITLL